jgi:maltose alpha-D-glucosyltransferase/alpha-amylase
VPPLAGYLDYRRQGGDEISLGILSGFVADAKDAWTHTLDTLSRFFDRVRLLPEDQREAAPPKAPLQELTTAALPPVMGELIGTYLEAERLLGQRTAEMHLALASDPEDKEFAAEPFTPFSLRSLYQSMRNLAKNNLQLLRKRLRDLPAALRPDAQRVSDAEEIILKRMRALVDKKVSAMRIRSHGDYHLGQVLSTGKDFVLIDFEGEPARPLGQRRIKRSPLRDVAGMIRSFHYAAFSALQTQMETGAVTADQEARFEAWARSWYLWVSGVFLEAYLEGAAPGSFLPKTAAALTVLLEAELLDKAMYELGYELNNRPDWVKIPIQGILQHLD